MTSSQKPQQILLDTDFIFGLINSDDSNHEKSLELLDKIEKLDLTITILNLVKQESVTLISRRINQTSSLSCLEFLDGFDQIFITEKVETDIWHFFKSFTKKNISYIDCANLYFAQEFDYKIATFDQFYHTKFRL